MLSSYLTLSANGQHFVLICTDVMLLFFSLLSWMGPPVFYATSFINYKKVFPEFFICPLSLLCLLSVPPIPSKVLATCMVLSLWGSGNSSPHWSGWGDNLVPLGSLLDSWVSFSSASSTRFTVLFSCFWRWLWIEEG